MRGGKKFPPISPVWKCVLRISQAIFGQERQNTLMSTMGREFRSSRYKSCVVLWASAYYRVSTWRGVNHTPLMSGAGAHIPAIFAVGLSIATNGGALCGAKG